MFAMHLGHSHRGGYTYYGYTYYGYTTLGMARSYPYYGYTYYWQDVLLCTTADGKVTHVNAIDSPQPWP